MTRLFVLAFAAALSLIGAWASPAAAQVPRVNHVFIVVLENEDASTTFGEGTEIPYLAKELTSQGAFVPNYYATGHFSLDNYISMVSGQAPNPQTQTDCQTYTDFLPGLPAPDGQVIGSGCVYPAAVETIANQLEDSGRTWRGYMQDMANSAPAQPASCRHPDLNSRDTTPDRYGHRPVRRSPQPLRLLPLDRRLADLPGERRRSEQARAGSALGAKDARLRVHHARSLQ